MVAVQGSSNQRQKSNLTERVSFRQSQIFNYVVEMGLDLRAPEHKKLLE